MFLRFYRGEMAEVQAKEFAKRVFATGKNVSPAQVQGYFLVHKASKGDEVVKNIEMIWQL